MSLKAKLEAGQAVGAFLGLRSPDAAELMSQAGYDFLLVDAEHSNIGPDSVLEMLRAIDRGRSAPLVRLSETSASQVQWALDGGAEGILFPRIREIGKRTLSVCRKNSVHFGILTLQEETLAYWKEQGAQFFAVGTDALFLTKSCRKSLDLWDKYSD